MKISRQPFPVQIVIDQKRQENAEYFNSLGSMITYDARCTREIKSRIAMVKKGGAFNMKNNISSSKLGLNLRKRLMKCYIWSVGLCGAENMGSWECRSEIPGKF